MYKVLDTDNNTHVVFESYIDACVFKGLDPKKAFKTKRNTKDRPKHFDDGELARCVANNWISQYVKHWLALNNLKGGIKMSTPDNEALAKLLIVLEAHALPTEPLALDKALNQAVEDYMILAERYDNISIDLPPEDN